MQAQASSAFAGQCSAASPQTHPVLVKDVGDDHQLAILLAIVDHGHATNLNIALERHLD
jgi:hypothetical protein